MPTSPTLPLFQVDAFSSRVFAGNPAAICPLERWLPEALMQAIAAENNLSETAFLVPRGEDFEIRWFTPKAEVKLCGHATLAAAYVLFERLKPDLRRVVFHSLSGPLTVVQTGAGLQLDFPAQPAEEIPCPDEVSRAFKVEPVFCGCTERDLMVVIESEEQIRDLQPDMYLLENLPQKGFILTAKGDQADFVSRFFAPALGVPEDPVTGSAHCTLAPYWSMKLNQDRLMARQLSPRGGEIECRLKGNRVLLSGKAILYLEGKIHLPPGFESGF
ncbi:MAG: PhzF family phenazine biosynthesis protein [Planctomycetota bacterium]|nr:MAG: PhzF family phenazine biosynthesis protein [Planctomycetota bacterium]